MPLSTFNSVRLFLALSCGESFTCLIFTGQTIAEGIEAVPKKQKKNKTPLCQKGEKCWHMESSRHWFSRGCSETRQHSHQWPFNYLFWWHCGSQCCCCEKISFFSNQTTKYSCYETAPHPLSKQSYPWCFVAMLMGIHRMGLWHNNKDVPKTHSVTVILNVPESESTLIFPSFVLIFCWHRISSSFGSVGTSNFHHTSHLQIPPSQTARVLGVPICRMQSKVGEAL